MKFEQLDAEMRVFERSLDQTIIPGMWMAAESTDGFTRLTKEVCQYEAPFDIRFSRCHAGHRGASDGVWVSCDLWV
jgi:hypothetical protein